NLWFGMGKKSSALGAKPKVECISIKVSRRQDGVFLPYPEGTRCILLLNVSKRPCGDQLHGGRFSCSATKYPRAKP
ncbi:hypothetical protein, partial [Brucella suis]|uniref:hypothetical protein n=1 Tax=Brucella suis TaxID=29461 RepID=UPI001AEC1E3C